MPVSGPDGTGCVMPDTAYDAYENYRVIRDSGRRPVNDPRKTMPSRTTTREQRCLGGGRWIRRGQQPSGGLFRSAAPLSWHLFTSFRHDLRCLENDSNNIVE